MPKRPCPVWRENFGSSFENTRYRNGRNLTRMPHRASSLHACPPSSTKPRKHLPIVCHLRQLNYREIVYRQVRRHDVRGNAGVRGVRDLVPRRGVRRNPYRAETLQRLLWSAENAEEWTDRRCSRRNHGAIAVLDLAPTGKRSGGVRFPVFEVGQANLAGKRASRLCAATVAAGWFRLDQFRGAAQVTLDAAQTPEIGPQDHCRPARSWDANPYRGVRPE